jgi:hypothetical protein
MDTEGKQPELDGRVNPIVANIRRWRRETAGYHRKFTQQAGKAFDFYDGDQWDAEDRKKLEEEGRPALTINLTRPQLDLLCGVQRQEKVDLKFIGRTQDDAPIAQAMTKLVKYVCDRNDLEMRQGDVFFDGAVSGRGWFMVEMSYRDDWLNGEIIVRKEDPDEVIIPRGVERDLSDCPWLLRIKRVPLQTAKRLWPKFASKFQTIAEIRKAEQQTADDTESDYGEASSAQPAGSYEVGEIGSDDVEIIEAYWEDFEPMRFMVDEATGDVQEIQDETAAKQAIEAVPNLKIIERSRRVIKCARVSGSAVIEGPVATCDNRYPPVPFFCYRGRRGDYGVVKNIIDPQLEVNKRRSQTLHIINTSANSGWIADDPELLAQLEAFGSRPGMTALKKAGTTYERIQPAALPAAVMQMEEQNKDDIKAISGVNSDLLGIREATQSGVAIDLRMRQGLTVIAQIFDNFRLALKEVARRIAARIVAYMPEDEIGRILGEEATPELVSAIKGADVLKYDLVAAQSPSSPSVRMSNFMMLMDMRKAGVPIPDDLIVEASDIPGKEKILEKLAQPLMPPGSPGVPPLFPGGGSGGAGNPPLPAPPFPAGAGGPA